MIDTKGVKDRRRLRFGSIADLRLELDRLAAAHRNGTIRAAGNWTPGQVLAHLAAFIDYGYDGYPAELVAPPWIFRAVFRLIRKRYISGELPAGVKIPRVKGGTVGADLVAFNEGDARLRRALARLESSAPTRPNPVLGRLTHDEWKDLHLRHAELHLGFLHAE